MAIASWPGTLPQTMRLGMVETHQAGFVRTPMDAGPAKTRKRFTFTSRVQTGTMMMTETQRETFETFFTTTLEMGSVTFRFNDPNDGQLYEWKFMDPPKFTAIAAKPANTGAIGVAVWRVNLSLERVN